MGWPAMPSWVPSQDYDSLEAFIRQAVDDMPVDPKKVHVTGYSILLEFTCFPCKICANCI